MIGGRCGCTPLVCVDMHGVVQVLYVVRQCDQIGLYYVNATSEPTGCCCVTLSCDMSDC